MTTTWLACVAGAFVVGSIPFGVIIGRARGVDIRAHGSGNVGATNVLRVLGRGWGGLCFGLDGGKGAGPVLVAGGVHDLLGRSASELTVASMWWWLAVALAAVLGHMFSPFIGFRGGKGVATGFGGLLAMWSVLTFPAIGALVVWYTVLRLYRYVSLASMAAATSLPVWYLLSVVPNSGADVVAALLHAAPPFVVTAALAGLVVFRHRGNIRRIRAGEEPKVGGATRRGGLGDAD